VSHALGWLAVAACCVPDPVQTTPVAPAPAPPPEPAIAKPEEPVEPPFTRVAQTAAPQELVFPDEPFRREQPKAGPPRPFQLPAMRTFALRSGVRAYLVEQHELPIVSIDLNFDGGALADPPGKEGLASVCMALVTEGTAALDKLRFSEALADLASSVSAYATDDAAGLAAQSLSRHFEATLALFADALLTPGLRAADFERLIQRRMEGVKQAKGTPASVAARVGGVIMYGQGHPFGAVVTEASLGAITLDDCRAFVKAQMQPANARLFVVGDLTEAQVRAAFEQGRLGAWAGQAAPLANLPAPKPPAGRIFFVDIPGSAQSQVGLMHRGPARTARDYFPTQVLGSVLGGGFSSRVNMNLREDKGYSYGARAGFSYSKYYGTFSATASVQADATFQSLLELRREVADLASNRRPAAGDELEREKQGAILALPSQFGTSQAALGNYRRLVYFGLPLDYFNTYVARVGAVTAAQVAAAARAHLRPRDATYLVVGDGAAKVIVAGQKQEPDPATGKSKTVWTREPYLKDGKQLTLREALADLAARGELGAGGLVELDRDGRVKQP
jgi:zinc protease